MTALLDRFEVRLASQEGGNSQARYVTVSAENEDHAREIVTEQEEKIVNFSLMPPEKDVWELPRHKPDGDPDSSDAHVDASKWDAYEPREWIEEAAGGSYKHAVDMANKRLEDLKNRIDVDGKGKVRGKRLNARQQARFLAHLQSEPYAIDYIRKTDPEVVERLRTVAALARATSDPEAWDKEIKRLNKEGPTGVVTAALYGLPWLAQINGASPTTYSSAAIQTSLHTGLTVGATELDTHDFFNDVSATEITGTGYTANGATLGTKTSEYDTATDQIRLKAANVSWTTSTLSATDAVVWVNTGGASSTDPIWGNIDFGATVTTTAGTFQITWDATGIVVFDVT